MEQARSRTIIFKKSNFPISCLLHPSVTSIEEKTTIVQVDVKDSRQNIGVLSASMENIIAKYCQISAVEMEETTTDVDSDADPPMVGNNTTILFHPQKTVRVSCFTKVLANITTVSVVVVVVVYIDSITGVKYLLVINNTLYMKGMDDELIPLFIIRLTDHGVDEYPKFMCKRHTLNIHAITVTDPNVVIPYL